MNRKESSRKPKKTISWEERNHLMLATLEETVVRIKTRRICCRIPWGFPDKCGATFRKAPGELNTNPRGFGHKARDNPTVLFLSGQKSWLIHGFSFTGVIGRYFAFHKLNYWLLTLNGAKRSDNSRIVPDNS